MTLWQKNNVFSKKERFGKDFIQGYFRTFEAKIGQKTNLMQKTTEKAITSTQLSEQVVLGMLEKKAEEVVIMNLREVKTAVADYFVICSGNSDTQIEAISESVEEQVKKVCDQRPWKREGQNQREWILIDYVDVVVHVFSKEKRKFYCLEELWGDARIQRFEESEPNTVEDV